MTRDTFHPTLVENGLVHDRHREYAEWARRTYVSTAALPSMQRELRMAETTSGDTIRYYESRPQFEPPQDGPTDDLIVRRHPFANGNAPHMHLWSQIIADVTGARVLSFPNNYGREQNESFSRDTARRMRRMGLRAIAMVHREIVEYQKPKGQVYPFGWSEGGSAAAALYAVSRDAFDVAGVGVGDPPTVMERGRLELMRAFADQGGNETYLQAARRADIPLLSEALRLDHDGSELWSLLKYARDVALSRPLARIALLQHPTLLKDTADGLQAHPGSRVLMFSAEHSNVAPLPKVTAIAAELKARYGSRIDQLVLEDAGHGAADQILDQAVIADHLVSAGAK